MIVGGSYLSEVRIIGIALHGIARVAQRLEVAAVICTPVIPRHNVVDLQVPLVRGDSAQLATELRGLEHVVANCAADVAETSCSVFPYGGPALFDLLS